MTRDQLIRKAGRKLFRPTSYLGMLGFLLIIISFPVAIWMPIIFALKIGGTGIILIVTAGLLYNLFEYLIGKHITKYLENERHKQEQ